MASAAAFSDTAPAADHIVDVLIAERAPRLTGSAFWPAVKPFLYGMLDYAKARAMASAIADLPGAKSLEHVSGLLDLRVAALHLDRVPKTGRCVVVCNHPAGLRGGIAVADAIKRVRDDAIFFANADAFWVCSCLVVVFFSVVW